ncbi:MAG TPA: hypothetical protein PKY59_01460 [Pyrinomonadaceae bacterium]|nr:hypothetical protein [Pyrinomonadaceae bacterium]
MNRLLSLILLMFLLFTSLSFSQKLTAPKSVGTWKGGGGDFQEFIIHRTETLKYYLDEDPNGRIFARICSKNKFPLAIIESGGSALLFFNFINLLEVPIEKVFFVRSSKCLARSEEYWFIPENKTLEYEEILRADKIKLTRLIEDYHENDASKEARAEFAENLTRFVEMMKADEKLQGFVIRGKKQKYLTETLRRLKKEKIGENRFKIIIKRGYSTYYPEFMTASLSD